VALRRSALRTVASSKQWPPRFRRGGRLTNPKDTPSPSWLDSGKKKPGREDAGETKKGDEDKGAVRIIGERGKGINGEVGDCFYCILSS